MKVLILGGGGMVGQKLAGRIAQNGLSGSQPDVTLFDMAFPNSAGKQVQGIMENKADLAPLVAARPDVIFHLAAVVSGEAEKNFEKGWSINGWAMQTLLELVRVEHEASDGSYRPKLVFTSSIAVFGPPFPEKIGDDFPLMPQTSYGAQKAISEYMLTDYSRKGYVDGISMRLPTICVRPGKANLAASSFFSGIIREPLNGLQARLPVGTDVRHWHASPRSAAQFLTHAAELDTALLAGRRALNLPGVSCTVEEQIEALRQVAGQGAVDLIKPNPDPDVIKIVSGWPRNFDPVLARELGFKAETDFKEIIETYIADDLRPKG